MTFLKMSAIFILESENRGCEPSVFRPGLFSTTSDSFYFNPRSPCGERQKLPPEDRHTVIFQSTLPVWGATIILNGAIGFLLHFNPRSPCGERLYLSVSVLSAAPFQSPLPVWGATPFTGLLPARLMISIPAPRVGSDHMQFSDVLCRIPISIPAPRVGSDLQHKHI